MEASSKEDKSHNESRRDEAAATSNNNNRFSTNFDAFNWMYWSLWWQQYYYWHSYLSHGQPNGAPAINGAAINGAAINVTPNLNIQHNIVQQNRVVDGRGPHIRVELRMFNGFETYIASIWYRVIAEVIDTILVCGLLTWYIPELDFRY